MNGANRIPAATAAWAALAGIAAAVAIPGNRAGAGLFATAVLLAVPAALAVPRERRPRAFGLGALALVLAFAVVLRDADWVVVIDLVAAAWLAPLAVAPAIGWSALRWSLLAVTARMPGGATAVAAAGVAPLRLGNRRELVSVARGLALGAVLLVIFGTLFVSADDAFAEILDRTVVPHWELGLMPWRAMTLLLVASGAAALVLWSRSRATAPSAPRERNLGVAEWAIALGLLDLLFAAFVAVQFAVLFGGHDHVLRTVGLTYAEYAHQGFAELMLVATLTLAVVAWTAARAQRATPAQQRLLQVLLGVLCLLTMVVLASALRRLDLYEDAFGFTRLRLAAHGGILWLGGLLVLVMAAGATRRAEHLPHAVAVLTGIALAVFTLANPDGIVAARNVDRFQHTHKIDIEYLSGLSADAVPQLARLPERQRECALSPQRSRLADGDSWAEANVARARARASLPAPSRAQC